MPIVAGVDFGTLSVRVTLVDTSRGRLGSGIGEYPLHRKKEDPDYATQSHEDHTRALSEATQRALAAAKVSGDEVAALAIDTTGSSVIPVGEKLKPLNEYYLWCDHRSWREAALITRTAHEKELKVIDWCGGTYSSEWGFSKLLHWLRNNPEKRSQFVTAFEHCDMIAAVLCGITDPAQAPRSVCAMGHKWMWNRALGGLPPEDFLVSVDPLLAGVRSKLTGRYLTCDHLAGHLHPDHAKHLGLRAGIPIPIGAFDAHWDAIGAGARTGDVVNVVGTSTCIIAMSDDTRLIPGVCGVVPGSVHPLKTGVEAGLSATGDIFEAIARRAGKTIGELSPGLETFHPGQTGLLRLTWDNGDRTVLVNPELGGVTFGWNLTHSAQDELFAAIEGTAFHTRVIFERMEQHGVPINRVINGGGIPQKNDVLNRVYANVLNKPVLIPQSEVTSLGSAIFAALAAGAFPSIETAQQALCPKYRVVEPDAAAARVYEELYGMYRELYFAFGKANASQISAGQILPTLRRIAAAARGNA
ncbi:MAG TPA: ribulokinase [Candidatus Saccharimonadales bacterium]|nr:ribulokinase [Candidatus Saccharimonadales bacterium]